MTCGQARFPIAPSKFKFAQHGKCGMWVSELLPWTGEDGRRHVLHPLDAHRGDQPRAGHHATCRPATRSPAGRASASWASLRPRLAQREPADVRRARRQADQHASRCRRSPRGCGQSGYLPGEHAGVSFRSERRSDPVHQQPAGRPDRRPPQDARRPQGAQRDELPAGRRSRNAHAHPAVRDGLPHAGQRAGTDRPRARSRKRRSSSTATRRRSPAPSPTPCCMARRLVERGVRFVQIYHNNWDTHGNVAGRLPDQCRTSTSRATA